MSIELKENDWAEKKLKSRDMGKKPSETLRRIARYYFDQGYSAHNTERKLEEFILCCNPEAGLAHWSDAITNAVKSAKKRKAINIDNISITAPEMETIDALDGKMEKRLAFTLLSLAKFHNIVGGESNPCENWVSEEWGDIFRMANISASTRKQASLYSKLRDKGLVQFSKKVDSTSAKVLFIQDGNTIMNISDFRNLGYQYLMFHDEPFFECSECGLVTKIKTGNGRPQKYCPDCAAKIHMKQKVESAMRVRYKPLSKPDHNKSVFTIYMHKCPNGKGYIGLTQTSLSHRWKNGSGYRKNTAFYSDIREFGWDKIIHYQIACVQDEAVAKDIEKYYIRKYKTYDPNYGYNRPLNQSDQDSPPIKSLPLHAIIRVDGKGNITE